MYNQPVMNGRAGYSLELLRKRALRRLHGHAGWLVFGAVGGLCVLCYFMFRPFVFEEGLTAVRKAAMWFAAWFMAFTELYLLGVWLAPRAQAEDRDLAHLPLPPGQHVLHHLSDLMLVPLVNLALSLPLFWIALVNYGIPYNEGAARWWRWFDWNWDAPGGYDPDPWVLRVVLIVANLLLAVLLPLVAAVLIELLVPWTMVRVAMLPLFSVGTYLLVRHEQVRYELFRFTYQQSRGLDTWSFLACGAMVLLLPIVVAGLTARWRYAVGAVLAVLGVAALVLILFQHRLPGEETTAIIRRAIGDARYALAYFICHLSPAENIDLLCFNYPTNVLLDDKYAHNLIPSRIALWVGAGIYPLLLCLSLLAGMWQGAAVRKRSDERLA